MIAQSSCGVKVTTAEPHITYFIPARPVGAAGAKGTGLSESSSSLTFLECQRIKHWNESVGDCFRHHRHQGLSG